MAKLQAQDTLNKLEQIQCDPTIIPRSTSK